jgi:RNA polymerase sigma factor (TIGR02999 family)
MNGSAALNDIPLLMAGLRTGDKDAARQLVELFYPELRRLAAARMRSERREHTLQPTALVNELYLQLLKIKGLRPGSGEAEAERADFLRLSAFLMRRLLSHHARPLSKRMMRGDLPVLREDPRAPTELLADIDHALAQLGEIDPRLREVVELRVFEELSHEEVALRLNCSVRTVARHWQFAQKWLETELGPLLGH